MKIKAIVIGAGAGGETCALQLQHAGIETILLEMHDKPGGLAQAWTHTPKIGDERVRVTYEITHAVSAFNPGEGHHEFLKGLGVDMERIGEFTVPKRFATLVTPEESMKVYNTIEENLDYLLQMCPDEKKGIEKLFRIIKRMDRERNAEGWRGKLESLFNFTDNPYAKIPAYLFTKPSLLRNHRSTFKHLLDRCTQNEDVRTWFSTLYGYCGLPPSKIAAIFYPLMLLSYWSDGGPQAPAHNSYQALHDEIVSAFVKHGGEFRPSTKSLKIVADQKGVAGVLAAENLGRRDEKKYCEEADLVVIAGDMKKAMSDMRDILPERYFNKLHNQQMSCSIMSVHAIVEPFLSDHRLDSMTTVLASSRDAFEEFDGNNFPEHYVMYWTNPTMIRPEAGLITDLEGNLRKDLHLIDIAMQSPSYDMWNALRKHDRQEYRKGKQWIGQKMLEVADRLLAPGLLDKVKHTSVYTAATHERFCNVTEGAVYTFNPTPEQFIPNRFSPRTPIKGLYITGSTVMSGGIGGAMEGAKMTFRDIMKDI